MDAAVWLLRAVVDQRQHEKEADALAHRQAREADRPDEASGRGARPPWLRRRLGPAPAVAVAGAPEQAGEDLDLVGVGQPH
jgi:hypothetical protein